MARDRNGAAAPVNPEQFLRRSLQIVDSSPFHEWAALVSSLPPETRADVVLAAMTSRGAESARWGYAEGVCRRCLTDCVCQMCTRWRIEELFQVARENRDHFDAILARLCVVDDVVIVRMTLLNILLSLLFAFYRRTSRGLMNTNELTRHADED
jgi:hypothetical protein